MNKGLNKVQIIGNLGNDPEIRVMPNGDSVANITVATSESWKDQQGQLQERTEWHRVVMYRKLAEITGQYLKKGSQVYLEGKLKTRKWQDQQGQDRYTTEVVAEEMQMLGGRQQDANQGQSQKPAHSQNAPQQQRGNGGYQQPNNKSSNGYQTPPMASQNRNGFAEPTFDDNDDFPM